MAIGELQQRWLSEGFPLIDDDQPGWSPRQAWQLIAEADQTLPAGQTLAVMLPLRADEFADRRPMLSRQVMWLDSSAAVTDQATADRELNTLLVADRARQDDADALRQANRCLA